MYIFEETNECKFKVQAFAVPSPYYRHIETEENITDISLSNTDTLHHYKHPPHYRQATITDFSNRTEKALDSIQYFNAFIIM